MGKAKNVFTMAMLHFIKNLLNFSLRVLPVFIIIISLLKVSKVLIDLNWYFVLSILLFEIIIIILSIVFDSLFFKNRKNYNNTADNNEKINNKFPILNVSSSFFAFLGIIFTALKLFKAIEWSWIWVLSPLWMSAALVLFILFISLIIFIISVFAKKDKDNNDKNNSIENASKENTENDDNISTENTNNQ